LNNDNYSLTLNCSTYNITNLLYFGISSPGLNEIINSQVCTNFSQGYELSLSECSNAKANLVTQLASNCLNRGNCTLYFNHTNFFNECNTNDLSSNVYISYQCFSEYIKLTKNKRINRSTFGFIVVSIDIVSMIALIITILL